MVAFGRVVPHLFNEGLGQGRLMHVAPRLPPPHPHPPPHPLLGTGQTLDGRPGTGTGEAHIRKDGEGLGGGGFVQVLNGKARMNQNPIAKPHLGGQQRGDVDPVAVEVGGADVPSSSTILAGRPGTWEAPLVKVARQAMFYHRR